MWKLFDKFGAQKQSLGGIANYGWDIIQATLTYSSADGHTFVCTTDRDLSGVIPLGARIRLTHAAATKYFIVTAIDAGTITLYGGTDYTLAAGAVTNPLFSISKAPIGFPLDPAKWTEKIKSTSNVSVATPGVTTWYNVISLAIPIGAWFVSYEAFIECLSTSVATGTVDVVTQATLSTTSSTESDNDFTAGTEIWQYASNSGAAEACNGWLGRAKSLILSAKTTYYLNMRIQQSSNANFGSINAHGDIDPSIIRAICAYP